MPLYGPEMGMKTMLARWIDLRLLRNVWKISWPTVIYSLMETGLGLVDIYLAGYIGMEAVASIGLCRQIFLIIMISTLAITTGTITLVAQHFGARRYEAASSVVYHSILLAVMAGLVLGVAGAFFAYPSLLLIGAKDEVLKLGTDYLQILLGGVIFMLINFATNGIFRAVGDAKTPLKIALFINGLNVLISWLLMHGVWIIPPYGISGIAMGTILARAIGAVLALRILLDRSRQVRLSFYTPFQSDPLWQILRIGFPAGLSGFLRNGARIIFFAILASTVAGTTALAAASIVFQIRMLTIMPSLAFQVAVAALVGQSLGRKNLAEAEAYGWTSLKLCSVLMGILSLTVFFFPLLFIQWFTEDPAVLALGKMCMQFIAIEQFCNCISIVASGALSGAGDTKPSLHYTLLSQWIIMLPLAVGLAWYTSYDIYGAWFAWGVAPITQALMTLGRFKRGKWKKIDVLRGTAPLED